MSVQHVTPRFTFSIFLASFCLHKCFSSACLLWLSFTAFSSIAISAANHADSRASLASLESNPSTNEKNSERTDTCEKVHVQTWEIRCWRGKAGAIPNSALCCPLNRSRDLCLWLDQHFALTSWIKLKLEAFLCVSSTLWKPFQKVRNTRFLWMLNPLNYSNYQSILQALGQVSFPVTDT